MASPPKAANDVLLAVRVRGECAERQFCHRLANEVQLFYLWIAKEIEDDRKGVHLQISLEKLLPERKISLFYKEYMWELVRNYSLPTFLDHVFPAMLAKLIKPIPEQVCEVDESPSILE